ncbi:XdhC family protein [Microbacterium sp. P07]|uniref:XdhC family protein n=1 Tax=Microbacterium sp. P07 TaxID=3366952 RepID=UPI003746F061
MLELAAALLPVLRGGEPVAVVTVARVTRSAPRGVGTAMALTRDGSVIGSISGGCVEGDAILLATEVLATGVARVASLGFSDDDAHAAGLACGGSVDVIVHRIEATDAAARAALEAAAADRATAVGLVASGARRGSLVTADAFGGSTDRSRMLSAAYDGADLLLLVHEPRRRLVIVGAGDHAMALARVASAAGFAVAVSDVWERLVTPERFPTAERIVVGVPSDQLAALVGDDPARAAVCVLTHDERVDVPAIAAALRLGVGFVGAMGARSTVAHRAALLRAAGVDDADLARLHSPLGLDLGGDSPDETALAVLAEIVAAQRGGTAVPLRDGSGPLHRHDAAAAATCTPRLEDATR